MGPHTISLSERRLTNYKDCTITFSSQSSTYAQESGVQDLGEIGREQVDLFPDAETTLLTMVHH